ncbi:MAG: dihydroneopterin aldolase [Chitinophagaceae bacterium]|nr:dihydroneopterin aldolase [Chitinophagaceae bacterium]MCW5905990.1 dihydroneopterin aldolase [Chitinophagaceae bacterium]
MNFDAIPKLSIIKVEKLRLRAYIGFIDWEKVNLQDIVISYSFKYNSSLATKSDDVHFAVNYKSLNKQIIALIDNKKFNLIEHVAEIIFESIQAFSPEIQHIKVKVEKPYALRFADNVLVKISSEDRYNVAMIALGSNINADENMAKALSLIQQLGTIVQRTKFIKTKALKFEQQPDYLNGAILLMTKKCLSELVFELKQIETMIGRVRDKENKNAPREIDLDVTTYNYFVIDKDINELPFLKDFIKELQPNITID